MATENKCPHCGKPVPDTALPGLCPECMLKAGLADTGEVGPDGAVVTKAPLPSAPRVEEIAPHFPQLEILESLGRGGMGAVYKARQPKLDRFVALKILTRSRDSSITDTEFAARFQQEARALARLNHPDIVAVYDFGEAGGYHYLLMEFVDGLTLRQLLQTRKLSPQQALNIVPKICEALQFAHERGIVHRDIKPENILLDKQGRVKIADFGIAKIVGSEATGRGLTGAKDVIGTPHYMAPEQVEKPATVDHRADIYSLGVVFYEMLTGELPLGKFQSPSRMVQVDVRLDEVVLHALEKDPDRRYQHVAEVKTDVETIADTPPNAPVTPEAAAAVPSSRIPNRWEAALLGVGLTVFIALLVLIPTASQPFRPVLTVLTLIGLLICFLTLAGWWPAPSFFLPDSGFSGRNLPGRKPAKTSSSTGCEWEAAPVMSAERDRIRREVKGPATGLLVTGILNWILIPVAIVVLRWIVPLEWRGEELHLSASAVTGLCWASLALCSFMIYAALKMMRLESRGMAVAASLAAMLVTPGNVIGLPLGIWSLVTLARADVRAAFRTGRGAGLDFMTGLGFVALGILATLVVQLVGPSFQRQLTATTPPLDLLRRADMPEADRLRALALFNDIEDFGHEFDAAFTSRNRAAAQTGTRRLLTLLTNFNEVMRGTDWQFPAVMFDDIAQVRRALDEGDWEKARRLAQHNEDYARAFRRIGDHMVALARQQAPMARASSSAMPLASVPAVVIATIPASGAGNVDPALTELRVTFSKPMQEGSWSCTTWGGDNFPQMTGQPHFLADGRTCVLPVKLNPGQLYATWLNSDSHHDFKDREGQPAVPYLLIFETKK